MYARRHRSDTLQFVNGAPVAGQPVLAAPFVGALTPKLAARAGGSISNVGSEAGHIGLPGGAA
jgi:hypothetical protein